MKAFHNDPSVKEKYLVRVREHRAADEIVTGQYWRNGRGCAVGCTIHGDDHKAYESELGIPEVLARLEDTMFEGMPIADSKLWPERFLSAIQVGADLSMVWPKFAVWLLGDEKDGVIRHAKTKKAKAAIQKVVCLFESVIRDEVVTVETWRNVGDAVYAAADAYSDADATYATAGAAADAYTAYSAAAAAAAYAVAADRAYTYDAAATRAKGFKRQSEKLFELLSSALKTETNK
jgi:hypothetical protein